MNVFLFIEFICGILLSGLIMIKITKKQFDFIELVISSLSLFLLDLCLISVALLLSGSFTAVLAYSLSIGLNIMFLLVLFRIDNADIFKKLSIYVSKDSLVVIMLLIFIIPIIYQRYEFIEETGDAGVYSVSAMNILKNGKLRVVFDPRIYLSKESRSIFDQDNLLFQNSDVKAGSYVPGTYLAKDSEEFYFQFYPAWPAMMALWGGIFGIEQQHFVMVILYISAVFLFYFIIKKFSHRTFLNIFITIALGSTPVIIHFTKYPTSELFLLFLVLFTCYNLVQNTLFNSVIAGFATLAFFLSHVSSFVYLPLFFAIFPFAHLERSRELISYCAIVFIGAIISIPYGQYVSNQYFVDVYEASFILLFNQQPVRYGIVSVLSVSLIGLIISMTLLILQRKEAGPKSLERC